LDEISKEALLLSMLKMEITNWKSEFFLKTLDTLVSKDGYKFAASNSETSVFNILMDKLDEASTSNTDSAKFAAIISHMLTHHEALCKSNLGAFRKIVNRLSSGFMQKIALKNIENLEKKMSK
jgi:hypothetical protein